MVEQYPDEITKQLQRAVRPVYIRKDGNIWFSSTATLVEYRELYFITFAYHAVYDDTDNMLEFGYISHEDGNFIPFDSSH